MTAGFTEMINYMGDANEEDRALVEALFQGSASSTLPKGTLHPLRKIYGNS